VPAAGVTTGIAGRVIETPFRFKSEGRFFLY